MINAKSIDSIIYPDGSEGILRVKVWLLDFSEPIETENNIIDNKNNKES